MTNPSRTGLFTTEFLVTLLSQAVAALLVKFGLLDPNNLDAFTKGVVAVVSAVLSLYTAVTFVWSRTKIKQALIAQGFIKPQATVAKAAPSVQQ